VHAREIRAAKGMVYWLCRLSEVDVRYRKYPTLPVVRCAGFEKREGTLGSCASEGDS